MLRPPRSSRLPHSASRSPPAPCRKRRADRSRPRPHRVARVAHGTRDWQPPVVDSTPDDPFETSVYRGLALLTHTRDSLPAYVGGNAELHELPPRRRAPRRTRRRSSASFARFPEIHGSQRRRRADRGSHQLLLHAKPRRIEAAAATAARCRTSSRISRSSRGAFRTASTCAARECAKMPALTGDSTRGRPLFVDNCARCHGNDGAGMGTHSRALGPEVVQHRRVDGAPGARGLVHSPQHAVRSPGHR